MPNQEKIVRRVFVTKYALTMGLWNEECYRYVSDPAKGKETTYWSSNVRGVHGFYREGKDAFLTEDEARQDVKKKLGARKVSLAKALKKIQDAIDGKDFLTIPIETKPGSAGSSANFPVPAGE